MGNFAFECNVFWDRLYSDGDMYIDPCWTGSALDWMRHSKGEPRHCPTMDGLTDAKHGDAGDGT